MAVGSSDEHLLKKPKLELSVHSQQDGDEDRDGSGGIDNNNVSPVSAFRPWNADDEGADDRGSESGHNGDVAERKLDPYLMRGANCEASRSLTFTIVHVFTFRNPKSRSDSRRLHPRDPDRAELRARADVGQEGHGVRRPRPPARAAARGRGGEGRRGRAGRAAQAAVSGACAAGGLGRGRSVGRPLLTFTLLQRLEDELSKKREELRDLLLMPASKKALPSAAAAADVRRKEAPTAKGDEEDAAAAAAGPSSSVGAAVCPSPLNLSAESGIDNAERSSSVDSALSKVRPRNCRVSQLFLQLSQTSRIPRTFENE